MSLFELVERLCAIARLQADIIKEQALALEQANITLSTGEELQKKRDTAAAELELIDRECN